MRIPSPRPARHPNLFLYHDEEQEREENEEQSPHPNAAAAAGPLQDEPYRDDVRNDEEDDATASASLLASQQSQMSTQDRHLDTLSLSISRQHNLSLQMNEELEMQHELLGDLDEDVDRTGLRLGRASGQLDRVKRGLKDHGERRGQCSAATGMVIWLTSFLRGYPLHSIRVHPVHAHHAPNCAHHHLQVNAWAWACVRACRCRSVSYPPLFLLPCTIVRFSVNAVTAVTLRHA